MNILVKEFSLRYRKTSRLPIETRVNLSSSNSLGIEYEDYELYTVIGLGMTNLNIIRAIKMLRVFDKNL
jgi:hypothetical protein